MPRQGRKRKKARGGEKEPDVGERQKKLTPRCFVIKRGEVGDRIKDLVQDLRSVMMPNSAKALKESKNNRVEDFIAVASHFNVTHLIIFTATKAATYMKLARLPQGPTLTFRVDSFTLAREVRAAQRRPQGSTRDFTSPPLQVLNGLGGPKDSAAGAGGGRSLKTSERQLLAEMLRGAFPAIDVPSFNQAECRRAVLFHYDRESDAIFFRHFVVGRRQLGLDRGIKKLTKFNRLPNLSGKADIADFVTGGGAVTSESEVDEAAEIPGSWKGGRVAVRLSEAGPRLKLLLVKAEEGVCTGGVMYHRFLTKTPSQQQVLQERARQRQKLRERNQRLEAKAKAKATAKKRKREKSAKSEDEDEDEKANYNDMDDDE